ncbi:hypothetical protein E4U30_000898 [Claviceps sp. LM220 group G6]|nr:hypothetical protein E4U15_001219 [Claviceps sp. LM218 group G6]KAG6101840.1 hypothetical protein E4U30_000898 [Claviceps sp. LM220 group G6]
MCAPTTNDLSHAPALGLDLFEKASCFAPRDPFVTTITDLPVLILVDDASHADKALIKDDLGIRTIIDLRTKTELIHQARKFSQRPEHTCANASSFSPHSVSTLPRINGIAYHDIKITGRPFEIHLIRQLSWWSFLKVIFYFVLGYRISAIRIIATEVMLPRGLLGLGIDTVDISGLEIKEALLLYVTRESLPILVHCTQGKDRTGLIISLVLMILDTPIDAIEHDYFLTNKGLEAENAQILTEVRQIGLTEEWATTSPVMIRGLQKHLVAKYGGLNAYLDGIGFGPDLRAGLRERLMY